MLWSHFGFLGKTDWDHLVAPMGEAHCSILPICVAGIRSSVMHRTLRCCGSLHKLARLVLFLYLDGKCSTFRLWKKEPTLDLTVCEADSCTTHSSTVYLKVPKYFMSPRCWCFLGWGGGHWGAHSGKLHPPSFSLPPIPPQDHRNCGWPVVYGCRKLWGARHCFMTI